MLLYLPNNIFKKREPILRSTPALEVGTPVLRAKFCFALVIPNARFKEKLNPGIPVFDRLTILKPFCFTQSYENSV